MQYSALRRSELTIWLRSDSYARLNHQCLGPSDVPPAVGCVNPGLNYFHTTGPIARDDETRRIDGSVHGLGKAIWSQKWEQQDSSTAGRRWRRLLKTELDGEKWSVGLCCTGSDKA